MRNHCIVAVISAGAAAGAAIAAPPTPTADLQCKFRHAIGEVDSITEVPPQVQNAMLARMDPAAREDAKFEWHTVMAPRGGVFNSTDVIIAGDPSRRFIRAGHVGSEWFVWFEQGGDAYRKKIALFHIRLGHANPIVRAFISYQQLDPCALTDDLIDNKTVPPPPGNDPW
ncbi:MAG: hypothetical protein ABSD74_06935 [Rhizomicrobium sp.]|jgi:hypothetical protein